jgi:integrase
MTVSAVLDAAGRRRSPATLPGYHAGRRPRNKRRVYPADPPTVEEIVAVMREASDDPHGYRLRALVVVLWRGGLRVAEALALGERDLDPRRGSLLVRNGKGGRRREIGMDAWGWEQLRPWLAARRELPSGPCSASSTARPAGGPGRAPTCASSFAGSPPEQVSGAASRRTSCATRMPSSSLAKACRSTSSSASSATPISARPRSTCRASTPRRSSPPCTPGAHR